ncbi:uncharacterized protein LOC118197974 [Stegodyphus dumicola]|uniref:uncharacterized protein LOC118197974 n=1 Tax=Stegodyphus dumicola TaxID=202533 RepID=UPI0015ACC5EB|nr:uncharacterized protein LOC118197974 [Stegodyphus dumicola]
MCMATWSSYLWSPWHEAILAWLRLLEGLLVPVLLFCKDHALRSALRRTFQRRSGALSPLVGDDGPFQMYFDKDHFRKRGTFGSVTPIGIITNYRRTPGKKRRTRKSSGKYTLPGLHNGDSVLPKSCFSASILGTEPLSKLSCADLTSLEMWREEDEENFYATLSDDFSSFSCKSADDSALSEDIRINEELYGGSFTTIANDDFEFHDTRPCGGEVKMKPALTQSPPHTNSFNAGVSRNVSFKENVKKSEEIPKSIPYERGQELFDFMNHQNEDEDKKDPNIFTLPSNEWKPADISTDPSSSETEKNLPRDVKNKFGTMSRHQKTTSYSMNDLDLIHHGSSVGNDLETTFILPVKSESTMSLYRLNVERDLDQLMISPSKSENNVNGDSGFGSGAQSTNPIWSGFLCRKPSDPFWNIRKPSTHAAAAVTPTKNYPGILHPRMRKIPWISAWKKLDENSDRNEIKNSHLKDNKMGWIDNITYVAKPDPAMSSTRDNHVGTIHEELSDVNSPIFNEDYNLNIFAKESGVLLENAYGKNSSGRLWGKSKFLRA